MLLTNCLSKALQLTLAAIKPDAVAHPLILEAIHQKILNHNFVIVKYKDLIWRRQDSERFYAEHAGRFFYQRLVEFMSSIHVRHADTPCWIANGTVITQAQGEAFGYHSNHSIAVTLAGSGPMRAYILAREDAISHWRGLMGPTKVFRARYTSPSTIRAQFGLTDTRNTTHGSDSFESAQREINFFFPEFSVDKWMETEEPSFRAGEIKYDQQRQIHTLQTKI